MLFPETLHYANTHEWVKIEDDANGIFITGISNHAQNELGDIVYVELPKLGQVFQAGDVAGVVESVKTASDIHAPLSGTVIAINTDLDNEPEIINEEPYDKGWIYKIQANNREELEQLLSVRQYQKIIEST